MTERFYIDNNGDLYDRATNGLLMMDFGENSANECNKIVELLNTLHEERNYFERKKEEFLSKWSIAHTENIQLNQENNELKEDLNTLHEENTKLTLILTDIMESILENDYYKELMKEALKELSEELEIEDMV